MSNRPAPKRRAEKPSKARTPRRQVTDTTADPLTGSTDGTATRTDRSAPGARRAAGPAGGRRAGRKLSLLPTPAVLGAVALVVAGGGAVIVSSNTAGAPAEHSYAPLAAEIDGGVATGAQRLQPVVSRSIEIDRETLDEQAELQAEQRAKALAELVDKANATAEEMQANQWVLPVAGYALTATWGQTSYLWSTYHTGLDFSAASGAPIVSIARGTVTYVGYDGAYGNKTEVTLDDGTVIWYAHQTSQTVSVGDEVQPGELIGYVGSTGNVTGPHLHLEVRLPATDGSDGQDVDPYEAFVDHGVTP